MRHHIGGRGATANIADVNHHLGQRGRNFYDLEQKFREGEHGIATIIGHFRRMGRPTMTRSGEDARALARMNNVTRRPRGFENKTKTMLRAGLLKKLHRAVRTRLLIRREQYFPAHLRRVRSLLESLQRREQSDETALHICDARTVEGILIKPATLLKSIISLVHRIVMTAQHDLHRSRGALTNTEGGHAGRIKTRRISRQLSNSGSRKSGGKLEPQGRTHAREPSRVTGTRINIGPTLEQRTQFGGTGR